MTLSPNDGIQNEFCLPLCTFVNCLNVYDKYLHFYKSHWATEKGVPSMADEVAYYSKFTLFKT